VKKEWRVTIEWMKYSIFILSFVFILGFYVTAHAQLEGTQQTPINITMSPQHPGPNQKVNVSVTSYATNIDASNITWSLNGKVDKNGTGEKTYSFTVGPIGTKTILDVVVKTVEGETVEKTFTLKPSSVDLTWQSYGFVPPFYKGKAMFSYQNKVTVIAIPHVIGANGQEVGVKDLIYKWKNNGVVADTASGYGKNSYTFTGSIVSRPVTVEVNVTTSEGDTFSSNQIVLTPVQPAVVFYRKDPLYGIEFQKRSQL